MSNNEVNVFEELRRIGSTVIQFGKFKGARFEDLTEPYRWSIYRLSRENPLPMFLEFRELHDQYTSILDRIKSPMQTKVWFGKRWLGMKLQYLYDEEDSWEWHIKKSGWGPELQGIARRYHNWHIRNPHLAEAENELYQIYFDYRSEPSEEDESNLEASDCDENEEYVADAEEHTLEDENMVIVPPNHDVDSDSKNDSLPSQTKVSLSSATKKSPSKAESTPQPKRRFQPYAKSPAGKPSSSRHRSPSSSNDDDDDDDDDDDIFTSARKTGKGRQSLDSESGLGGSVRRDSDRAVAERLQASSRKSKNRRSVTIVISSESDTDNEDRKPRDQKPKPPTDNTGPVDSDDESLVAKLQKEKNEKNKL
ncbi:hypothetical protein F4804DRAFT_309852 [Jackrogersella minutella]|nr:hypothetical protein F4804DRAFT_309852 [Jackrogersella minutella]